MLGTVTLGMVTLGTLESGNVTLGVVTLALPIGLVELLFYVSHPDNNATNKANAIGVLNLFFIYIPHIMTCN